MIGTETVDTVIHNVLIYNGEYCEPKLGGVAILGEHIVAVEDVSHCCAKHYIDGQGHVLAPGFIDVHTHDDLEVLRNPHMLCKLSQGVTTVITGNCGISAAPFQDSAKLVDPINLLGDEAEFEFATLADYQDRYNKVRPSVNTAMLIGHTSLRAQVMSALDRTATAQEIAQMKTLLSEALADGAIGFSTGLAYGNANAASASEVCELIRCLVPYNGIYTTHLRTEFDAILDAMDEAFESARSAQVPLVISHLKCAGKNNWGRAKQILAHLEKRRQQQSVCCDCYPYAASSSTLDLKQVTDNNEIFITWSESHPEMAQKTLKDIASKWHVSLYEAAQRLRPAGAVYHCMDEQDVQDIVCHEHTMIGSDGLPCDPHPHPRLWGTFPRVLGKYARQLNTLELSLAIHKMTALSSRAFGLKKRGEIKVGYFADLVLFDANTVSDQATYSQPHKQARGIKHVWVNGRSSFKEGDNQSNIQHRQRAGRFLARSLDKE
ncbi:N-acyl-D-amino-acid deacylase family protein [Pseudoalteromonas byunsanensis]|uniref:D-aminoacylase n=1 Tax=Pseudoalteromonas byunsanensis TaxID=327939 RepID=A0A1S1N8A3_9GAMM|nr:D-aminoacylase [Pseudoalteromonas byunsanensis]OHU95886.1 D-aminoacylase [Pseudoalteromonas byunsanensis]